MVKMSIEGFTTWPPCLAFSNRTRMSVPQPLHRTGPNGREDNPTPESCKPELEEFSAKPAIFFDVIAKVLPRIGFAANQTRGF